MGAFASLCSQLRTPNSLEKEDKRLLATNAAIERGDLSIAGAFGELLTGVGSATSSPADVKGAMREEFSKVLRYFFNKYDLSGDGTIDIRCGRPPSLSDGGVVVSDSPF